MSEIQTHRIPSVSLGFIPSRHRKEIWVLNPDVQFQNVSAEFCKTAISNILLGLNETATTSDTWSLTRYHITKLGWSVKCPWLNTQLSTHLTAEYAPFFPGHPDSITPTIAKPHVTHVDLSKLLQIWGYKIINPIPPGNYWGKQPVDVPSRLEIGRGVFGESSWG